MVGTRRNLLNEESRDNGDSNGNAQVSNSTKYDRVDLETGYGSINPLTPRERFRDAIQTTMKDIRAQEMKKKLIENVDHSALEIYRKSEQSVRSTSTHSHIFLQGILTILTA